MATRELITEVVKNDTFMNWGFNISDTVGAGGKNLLPDVMLIQAMLKFIDKGAGKLTKDLAAELKALPNPSGHFDSATDKAIRGFQRSWEMHLIKQDGLVYPASFKTVKVKFGGRQMMIFQLNIFAKIASGLMTKDVSLNYTERIFEMFPQLKPLVKDIT